MTASPLAETQPPRSFFERVGALAGARFRWAIGAIVLVAFVLRVVARAAGGAAGFWTNSYFLFFMLAKQLAEGHGYAFPGFPPTAFRVPFYPIFLAAVTQGRQDFWAVLIAQALVSAGTVACVAWLARLWFGRPVALVAAWITALYPYYLWHDTALQETGFFTFLATLAMALVVVTQRRRGLAVALLAGLVLGLAILTRATLMPFALFAVFWLLMPDRAGAPLRRRMVTALLCLAALGATLSPWLIRAHQITGRYTLGTEFGAAVWGGNNPMTFRFYPRQSIDLSRRAAILSLTRADRAQLMPLRDNEAEVSDWFLRRGLSYIYADPARFMIGAMRKNIAAFGVLPSPRHDWKTDAVQALAYGPMLVLGLIGLWRTRSRWREFLPVYGNFLLFAGITGVLWGHSSHRAFLDVYLIIFASSVIVPTLHRIGGAAPVQRR
ncbi:glycosyltransferase family 39 protein [Sphingomonas sp. MMS24-J45]|uniref:glycosyltransferase family 39 protein n=1 Tax=Sphingomonas sp. MMS24-J45 TaxID=3238806 RepID=UPI00384D9B06